MVYGSLAALPHLRSNAGGGALINVASEVSDAASPMLGIYASVKPFTACFDAA